MFEVSLKAHHPTGVYHRAGMEFTRAAPVQLDFVPKAVKDDPWLIVKKIEADGKAKGEGKSKSQPQTEPQP